MAEKKSKKEIDESLDKAVAVVKEMAATLEAVEKGTPAAETAKAPKPKSNSRVTKDIERPEKLSAKIATVEDVKGPTVIVGGVRLAPIETGILPTGPVGDLYSVNGKEYWLPHQVVHNPHTRKVPGDEAPWSSLSTYKGPEMSLFVFVHDSQTFHLLMDEHSSFIRNDDDGAYYPRGTGGYLIMINSSSHNDIFLNNACLVNVDTKQCLLNRSSIIANSRRMGREMGWGSSGPFKQGNKRPKYENLMLKRVEVIDSELTRGRYTGSTFNKVTVEGANSDNLVTNSNLTESRVQGQCITMNNLRTEAVDISSQGKIVIKGVGLITHQDWRFPSIYITNRFAFTEIDYITRQDRGVKVVRISKSEVEVRINNWKEGITLQLDTPRHTIEELLRNAIDEDKGVKPVTLDPSRQFGYLQPFPTKLYDPIKPGETIKNFALQCLVDQVFSRLGMIQLLDEVEETADTLSPNKPYELENFYE